MYATPLRRTCMDVHAWTYMHGRTCMHVHACTYMHARTCMDVHAWTYMHGRTSSNAYVGCGWIRSSAIDIRYFGLSFCLDIIKNILDYLIDASGKVCVT